MTPARERGDTSAGGQAARGRPATVPPATAEPVTTEPARPERRSDRKRAAILEAATEAFLQRGYLGTSMDEIAAQAAVSKQTVYKHFADKEQPVSGDRHQHRG